MVIIYNIDLRGNELHNMRLENSATIPDPLTKEKGHMYFNTVSNSIQWNDGTSWNTIDTDLLRVGSNISGLVNDVGYLTTASETDPVFTASPANSVTAQFITNWNLAFGWGDHSLAGYLTSYTEVDTLATVTSRNAVTTNNITVGTLDVVGDLTVTGPKIIIDTTTILLGSEFISLNYNATGSATNDVGFIVNRGTDPNRGLKWLETGNVWQIQEDDGVYKTISTQAIATGSGEKENIVPRWLVDGTFADTDIYSTAAGNVGIGVQFPTDKLEIDGNIKADNLVEELVVYIEADYALPASNTITSLLTIRVVNVGILKYAVTTDVGYGDTLNGEISVDILPDEAFTIKKRTDKDYRIV